MNTLFTNIKLLVQTRRLNQVKVSGNDMSKLDCIKNAFLYVNGNLITNYGKMKDLDMATISKSHLKIVDCKDCLILPSFCDSHTHIVYAGSREIEYMDKIKGLSYEQIAKRGGGILNSVERLRKASEDELYTSTLSRIEEIAGYGTAAVEIKSGYGLDTKSELKMLRVIQRLKNDTPLTIKATFLGAHAVPSEYKANQTKYVDLIIKEMIPEVAKQQLADYIDVFCDKGFFTTKDTSRMLEAGIKYGLKPKIHANELACSGGVQVGVAYDALSVDHLECMGDEEINCLLNSSTMPTVLPGAAFFLNMPYSPVRQMINKGLPVALASDYNPGSSPSGNMKFIMSLGCINYKMLPEEVINACTMNTAYAMGVSNIMGSIDIGKQASFYITKEISGYEYIPYAYTADLIKSVYINGTKYL